MNQASLFYYLTWPEIIDQDQYKTSALIELGKVANASSAAIDIIQWLNRLVI